MGGMFFVNDLSFLPSVAPSEKFAREPLSGNETAAPDFRCFISDTDSRQAP